MPAKRVWADTIVDLTIGNASQDSVDLSSTFLTNEMRLAQMTFVRTIIGIDVAYSVHDAGEGSQQVSLGICVVSREAEAAGVFPDPNNATDYPICPWVYRGRYRVYGFAADQPAVFNARIDLDIRAQRKMENGEVMFIANNQAEEGAASSILISGMIRTLFLVS